MDNPTDQERIEAFLADINTATVKHGVLIDDCEGCGLKLLKVVPFATRPLLPTYHYACATDPTDGVHFAYRKLN